MELRGATAAWYGSQKDCRLEVGRLCLCLSYSKDDGDETTHHWTTLQQMLTKKVPT